MSWSLIPGSQREKRKMVGVNRALVFEAPGDLWVGSGSSSGHLPHWLHLCHPCGISAQVPGHRVLLSTLAPTGSSETRVASGTRHPSPTQIPNWLHQMDFVPEVVVQVGIIPGASCFFTVILEACVNFLSFCLYVFTAFSLLAN